MFEMTNKVLLRCQQCISLTKYSNILCMSTFFKMNNLFYKFISESSLYAEYFLKVLTAVCMDKRYPR